MIRLKRKQNHVSFFSARDLSNLTTDYRFGFGTAMDKVIEPFTNTDVYQ